MSEQSAVEVAALALLAHGHTTAAEALEEERDALQSQVAALREALEHMAVADKDGKLHDPECMGKYGYSCKAWCDVADILTSTASTAQAHDQRVRDEAREECANAAEYAFENVRAGEDSHDQIRVLDTLRALKGKP